MDKEVELISAHEHQAWDKIYQKQLENFPTKEFSSYWWEYYYSEIRKNLRKLLGESDLRNLNVLEVGSGTGKATLTSIPETNITFLDLSTTGLELAKILSRKYQADRVSVVVGNMFNLPFSENEFDFVWNIGTLEHYDSNHIKAILKEMIRVTNINGRIVIAVPNHNSLPMLKARLLGSQKFGPYLKLIPGYRADSEKNYSGTELIDLITEVGKESNVTIDHCKTIRIGSPLFVGSNKLLVNAFRIVEKILPQSKFLILVTAVKKG
jgi:ubiquinone/menaquinone biosynthesis C-methylase UbiE